MAIIAIMGMHKQIKLTVRHAMNVLNRKTKENPKDALIFANAVNTPRIDGSLN